MRLIPRLFTPRDPRIPGNPNDSSGSYRAVPDPAEMTRAANLDSILAIPPQLLPADSPARRLLLAEASVGRDVYAYQGSPHYANRWYVWYGPLADADRLAHDGRIPAQHWAAHWAAILLGMASGAFPRQTSGAGWERAVRAAGAGDDGNGNGNGNGKGGAA